jgi:hypothetical protein
MITPQFIAAGKKNLEKCPARHGKKNLRAGRPKSWLKGYITENDVCQKDLIDACKFVLFNFSLGGLKDFVVKERDKAPALITILAEKLLDDAKKGRMNTVERMLDIIFGKGSSAEFQQNGQSGKDIELNSNDRQGAIRMLEADIFFDNIKNKPLTKEFLRLFSGRFQINPPTGTLYYETSDFKMYNLPDNMTDFWDTISKSIKQGKNLFINPDKEYVSPSDVDI